MSDNSSVMSVFSNIAKALRGDAVAADLLKTADRSRDAREWDAAREYYRRYLDRVPDDAGIWVQYGHALKESGHLEEAEAAYRQSIEHDPTEGDSFLQLGHALKLLGRREAAARAYAEALERDPASGHARIELLGLGWSRDAIRSLAGQGEEAFGRAGANGLQVAFDVSDLMHYFLNARLPTGIQRVQINIISSLIDRNRADVSMSIVSFSEKADCWVDVPLGVFQRVCALAVTSGDRSDPAWIFAVDDLRMRIDIAEPFQFPQGAFLVNLGTSWWLRNYFLMVRHAKTRYGIRYVPFVHDLIPVKAPEHCVKELTRDFIGWLIGVFFHADGYLVNSKATAADLVEVAEMLGHQITEPKVVRLDGRFSAPFDAAAIDRRESGSLLLDHGLDSQPYVLFVSTIESRKNHLLAFDAWLKMLKARGPRDTPTLVCVGNSGWMVDAALARLSSSELLKSKVILLSKVPDQDLAELYRKCLFTIYPSTYEGWGLPVTESLCHGKAALVAEVSSLPEAGGPFVDYFDPASARDFIEKLERLIDDVAFRGSLEKRIASSFRPREWSAVGEEIVDALKARESLGLLASNVDETLAFYAAPGVLHRLSQNEETTVWKGMIGGEMYRSGREWNFPDDWGCWMRASSAELTFRIPRESLAENGEYFLVVSLQGLPAGTAEVNYRVSIVGVDVAATGRLAIGAYAHKRLTFRLPAGQDVVRLRFTSDVSVDLSEVPDSVDKRRVTLGVSSFYYGRADDVLTRLKFAEALAFSDLDSLCDRPSGHAHGNGLLS